jgi:hypothetical protein
MAASGNVLRRSSTYSKFFEKMELQGMTARQCFKKKMAFSHTDPENPWTPTPPLHDHTNILQQILNLTPLEKFNFFFWKGGRGGGFGCLIPYWSSTYSKFF